jgi:hypothetical protein
MFAGFGSKGKITIFKKINFIKRLPNPDRLRLQRNFAGCIPKGKKNE